MLVIVNGAPGSGKTTMGTRLGVELRLPHLNRDLVRDGLWMTDGDDAAVGMDRAWRIWLSAVKLYLDEGVSVVIDQTFYRGLSDVTLRSELVPVSLAVNVHLMASNATERWCARIDRENRCHSTSAARRSSWIRPIRMCRSPLSPRRSGDTYTARTLRSSARTNLPLAALHGDAPSHLETRKFVGRPLTEALRFATTCLLGEVLVAV